MVKLTQNNDIKGMKQTYIEIENLERKIFPNFLQKFEKEFHIRI